LGKLRVVHFLSFDKSCLKRPSMLPQLALSNFYHSHTYELNAGTSYIDEIAFIHNHQI